MIRLDLILIDKSVAWKLFHQGRQIFVSYGYNTKINLVAIPATFSIPTARFFRRQTPTEIKAARAFEFKVLGSSFLSMPLIAFGLGCMAIYKEGIILVDPWGNSLATDTALFFMTGSFFLATLIVNVGEAHKYWNQRRNVVDLDS